MISAESMPHLSHLAMFSFLPEQLRQGQALYLSKPVSTNLIMALHLP